MIRYVLPAIFILSSASGSPPLSEAQKLEFFEKKIRPLLAENCFECHGPSKQKNGLRLDSIQTILKGGKRGPAVKPGDPNSLLLKAISYTLSDLKMPPTSKLSDDNQGLLKEWVNMGAPWPKEAALQITKKEGEKFNFEEARKSHWSFRPIASPAIPTPGSGWAKTPLDHFVFASLEKHKLAPSPEVGRRKLIRRAYFDLIGLPPTYEEVESFVKDTSPDAYGRLIEKLLDSPHYGERWGRHWLDLARYSDTMGYNLQGDKRYPYAYTYRDYVVNAFNEDKPYDRFILEQLAADKLDDKAALPALGFLTVGRWFQNNRPEEVIDDQIDTVTRGLLGLNVSCARCHDHKFDPVPTDDYYSLYGIFGSTEKPESDQLPVFNEIKQTPEYLEYKKGLELKNKLVGVLVYKYRHDIEHDAREWNEHYLVYFIKRRPGYKGDVSKLTPDGQVMRNRIVGLWGRYLNFLKTRKDPVFELWHRLDAIKGEDYESQAAKAINALCAPRRPDEKPTADLPHINPLVAQAFRLNPTPKSMVDVASIYGRLLDDVYRVWQTTQMPPEYHKLNFVEVNAGDLKPKRLEDGSWLMEGPGKKNDTYTILAKSDVEGITGVRLDVLPHPSLPRNGPGRFKDGDFRVSELKIFADGEEQQIRSAWSSFDRNSFEVVFAFDGDIKKSWAVLPQVGRAHWAEFTLAKNLAKTKDLKIVIQSSASNLNIGRFRLRVITGLNARDNLRIKDYFPNVPGKLADVAMEEIRQCMYQPKSPHVRERKLLKDYILTPQESGPLKKLMADVTKYIIDSPAAPPRAMVVRDTEKLMNPVIFMRGNKQKRGKAVPRRFLQLLAHVDGGKPFTEDSGRLGLARAIVDKKNPLTARVIVNRVWQHHFGHGIVRTPSNFGTLGTRPTHPDLLDHLATWFMENGWSFKKLHRYIMSSATYQQASDNRSECVSVDADNQLLWKMNRRRLEFEPMRDAILHACGRLEESIGGPSKQLHLAPFSNRRAIYGFIDRQDIPNLLATFDMASPDISTPLRSKTTVPQQALFMMNSPFILEQSKTMAARPELKNAKENAAKVEALYRLVYSRLPQASELELAAAFLEKESELKVKEGKLKPDEKLAQILLSSNEFLFVD